jgi:hypothetical protein
VTILDADDKLVTHLGDGKEADGKKTNKPDNKSNPALFATPHAMCVDSMVTFTWSNGWILGGRESFAMSLLELCGSAGIPAGHSTVRQSRNQLREVAWSCAFTRPLLTTLVT